MFSSSFPLPCFTSEAEGSAGKVDGMIFISSFFFFSFSGESVGDERMVQDPPFTFPPSFFFPISRFLIKLCGGMEMAVFSSLPLFLFSFLSTKARETDD